MKKINYKYVNFCLILIIVYLLFLLRKVWLVSLLKIFNIIFPFVISFCIAYVLYPFVNFLKKRKIPGALALTIVIITIILLFGLTLYFALPVIFNQSITFVSSLLEVTSDLASKYDIDLSVINDFISNYSGRLFNMLGDFISNGTIVSFLSKSVDYITKIIIIFISTIYFLSDMPKITSLVKNYLIKTSEKKYKLISKINKEIYSYLRGLGLFMIIQFFEYAFLFFIIGHPNFLLIGILASVTTIIPYFGGLITNLFALIIASVISPKLFILSLIITIVFPNIDGYIISPKIYDKTNQLPPLLSIFSVFVGGALFGFIGIVIAVPLTIIIISIFRTYKYELKNQIVKIKSKAD